MPIVSIHSAARPADVAALLGDVQRAGAEALGCARSNIWPMFATYPADSYLPDREAPPAVVIVRANAGRSQETRTAFVAAVADAVARGLSLPSTEVWIHYQEMQPADVWFEGHWS